MWAKKNTKKNIGNNPSPSTVVLPSSVTYGKKNGVTRTFTERLIKVNVYDRDFSLTIVRIHKHNL